MLHIFLQKTVSSVAVVDIINPFRCTLLKELYIKTILHITDPQTACGFYYFFGTSSLNLLLSLHILKPEY